MSIACGYRGRESYTTRYWSAHTVPPAMSFSSHPLPILVPPTTFNTNTRLIPPLPQLGRYWRNMQSLGDAKAGTYMGTDRAGNKYYEDLNEIPGRHRWVEYAQNNEVNASQIDPAWHGWLHHTHKMPPEQNPNMGRPTWESVSVAPLEAVMPS